MKIFLGQSFALSETEFLIKARIANLSTVQTTIHDFGFYFRWIKTMSLIVLQAGYTHKLFSEQHSH